MTARHHLQALLYKNWLIWKRNVSSSIWEVALPLVLMLILLWLRYLFPSKSYDGISYAQPNHLNEGTGQLLIPPINSENPFSLYETAFADLYPDDVDRNDTDYRIRKPDPQHYRFPWVYYAENIIFTNWSLAYVPALNESSINQALAWGSTVAAEYAVKYHFDRDHRDFYLGTKEFESDDDLEDYVTRSSYDDDDNAHEKVVFGVVVDEEPEDYTGNITLKWKLRFNSTDTRPEHQSIRGTFFQIFGINWHESRNEYQRNTNTRYQQKFYNTGFLQMQTLVYNYILQQVVNSTEAYLAVCVTPVHGLDHNHDRYLESNETTLGFFLFISSIIPFVKLLSRIVTDKEYKIREVMKMMGLSDYSYWLSWMIMYIMIYLFIAVTSTMILADALFSDSSPFVVFLMFFLYGTSWMGFSMLISTFFQRAKTAILIGVLVFFVTYFAIASFDENTPYTTKAGLSIFHTVAMAEGFTTLLSFQFNSVGINFTNLGQTYQHYTVGTSIAMLTIDTVLYILLALYLDKVLPKEYGKREAWYFPFTPSFWTGRSLTLPTTFSNRASSDSMIELPENQYLRQLNTGQAMQIRNLRKEFGPKVAVENLTLDIFQGQIFALLGHNGAGKTTTISMLTGLIEPTEGDTTVYGNSILSGMPEIRRSLGVCPQHNILFDDVTVYEHLYIFCKFKGLTDSNQIQRKIDEKIMETNLIKKRDVKSKFLSGGQKRKLSLAMALIADSSIVILDEPTSGMDTSARRKTWDMLKNNKQGRIVIMTTHHMEEADILADRIAIMAEGQLKCVGSPLFLKNRYGSGYTLKLSRQVNQPIGNLYEFINYNLQGSTITSEVPNEITVSIPQTCVPQFKNFFAQLDSSLAQFGLTDYSISITTMEEVFLEVGTHEQHTHERQEVDLTAINASQSMIEQAGVIEADEAYNYQVLPEYQTFTIAENRETEMKFWRHLVAMIRKRIIYSSRDLKGIIFEVALPILLVLLGLILLTQIALYRDQEAYKEEISKYETPQPVRYNEEAQDDSQMSPDYNDERTISDLMDIFEDQQGDDVIIESYDSDNMTYYNFDQYIFDDRPRESPFLTGSYYFYKFDPVAHQYEVVLYHNTTAYQSIPTFYNALAQAVIEFAGEKPTKLELKNHPLPLTQNQQDLAKNAGTFFAAMIFCVGMAFIPTGLITFIVKERENNVKHQHSVSGVSISAYWVSNWIWDFVKHLIPAVFCVLMITWFNLKDLSTKEGDVYLTVWILFLLFGLAVAPFCYLTSFMFKSYTMAQYITFIFNIVTGAILVTLSWLLRILGSSTRNAQDIMQWIWRLSPIYCFGYGISNASNRLTYQYIYEESSKRSALDIHLAGGDVLYLAVESVVYFLLIFAIERGLTWNALRSCLCCRKKTYVDEEASPLDEDVAEEARLAAQINPDDVAVKVSHLRKVYGHAITKDLNVAVKDLSFIVKRQQCFALLGVNGAGKTSTFKILTGEYAQSGGEVYINGKSIMDDIPGVRQQIGYCPQFDSIIDLLTAKEHLELYARIKGIPKYMIKQMVADLIDEMDLTEFANIRAGVYSGGNKRKLSVAIACIGNPPVVFLDEPSAGLDPDARRKMWKVINAIKQKKTSLIFTTHYIDEAELLCDRVGIMVAGQFKWMGSVFHIKNKFGEGYEFQLKVLSPTETTINEAVTRLSATGMGPILSQPDVLRACEILGHPEMVHEISERGVGASIWALLQTDGACEATTFVEWIYVEQSGQAIYDWMGSINVNASLIEHYMSFFSFIIEINEHTLGQLFGLIEDQKNNLYISEYSISQVSLEHIFNNFATNS